jgi:hypothetical protein
MTSVVGACAYNELDLLKDIDLVHYRIGSIPALKLERFTKLEVKEPQKKERVLCSY